jgi:hypothetical protein
MSSLIYSGEKITWAGFGEWPATSGMDGFQSSEHQHIVDTGPIPEGTYTLSLKIGGNATVTSFTADKTTGRIATANLDVRSEIQSLTCIKNPLDKKDDPTDDTVVMSNWGSNRVRLARVKLFGKNTAHRGGFYIHDSTKGFTHGCIEVGHGFFAVLREFAKNNAKKQTSLGLLVLYTDDTTRGKTKTGKPVVTQCS